MKPTLGITMGDPAGVGPEIIVKALQQDAIHAQARVFVIGAQAILTQTAQQFGIQTDFAPLPEGNDWQSSPQWVPVYQVGNLTPAEVHPGEIAAHTGHDSVVYVETAAELGKQGHLDAIVTAPINKEAMRAARVKYPGHTEILGACFNSPVETMFVVDRLRIFFLTRHLSLRQAIDAISKDKVLKLIAHAREVLAGIGLTNPVIAIAGLNPHAGDGGLFGDEEIVHLQPAVQEATAKGWDVRGPIGADSVFHQALHGKYDAVISLYHDQGHIASKTYDFNRTVSVTTGLPTIRTSVDHGTAFDIAGQGIADPTNLLEALKVATEMAVGRLGKSESQL